MLSSPYLATCGQEVSNGIAGPELDDFDGDIEKLKATFVQQLRESIGPSLQVATMNARWEWEPVAGLAHVARAGIAATRGGSKKHPRMRKRPAAEQLCT